MRFEVYIMMKIQGVVFWVRQ